VPEPYILRCQARSLITLFWPAVMFLRVPKMAFLTLTLEAPTVCSALRAGRPSREPPRGSALDSFPTLLPNRSVVSGLIGGLNRTLPSRRLVPSCDGFTHSDSSTQAVPSPPWHDDPRRPG
jgi:hypothetical protein